MAGPINILQGRANDWIFWMDEEHRQGQVAFPPEITGTNNRPEGDTGRLQLGIQQRMVPPIQNAKLIMQ